jgi:hypothetical protein
MFPADPDACVSWCHELTVSCTGGTTSADRGEVVASAPALIATLNEQGHDYDDE